MFPFAIFIPPTTMQFLNFLSTIALLLSVSGVSNANYGCPKEASCLSHVSLVIVSIDSQYAYSPSV